MRQHAVLFFAGALLIAPAPVYAEDELDLQRMRREIEELRKTAEKEIELRAEDRKDYQKALDDMRQELTKVQERAVGLKGKLTAAEVELQMLKKRNELLEKQIQTSEKIVASSEKREPAAVVVAPAVPEGPVDDVYGKISRVSESGLYVISVGSEDGLKQGYVLDVYRKGETPTYLGTITLVRAYSKQGIGNFKAVGQERPEIGDDVVARVVSK